MQPRLGKQALDSNIWENSCEKVPNYDVCIDFLKAIANLSSVLLSNEDLARGVNEALKIIGTSAKADRIGISRHYDDPTHETLGYVIAEYEWLAGDTDSQVHHPELHRIPYDGVEDCYDLFCAGKHWGGLIDRLPEPFRSGQKELGVKATYAIPILIQEKYWGIIGLDFCQTGRLLEDPEIEVLKTAAICIGSAIERERILREQKSIKDEAFLTKQKSIILTERDRILNITTNAAQALLNSQHLEQAIFDALQIIGDGIKTDRVAVMEHHHDSTAKSRGYLKMLYEWHLTYAVSQLNHPNLNRIAYEGIEDWYELLNQGQAVGGLVEELPEPVRSGQREIGVKSTYAVPITIKDKYWGILAFDDCREAKQRTVTEISILKTTAVCLGSAIEQNRLRRQQEEAERNILLERQKTEQLAEHNRILQQRDRILNATSRAAHIISTETDFDLAINQALKIIGESIDTDRVGIMEHFNDPAVPLSQCVRVLYEWDSIYATSQINHPELDRVSYEGIEHWYELMCQGKWAGGVVDEFPEPFRSKMKIIEVKSTYAIPIMVEGKYWGIVGIDNCRQPAKFNRAEINILQTAAACIGGAITKERSRCAQEAADKAILWEREQAALEKATQLINSNQTLSLRDRWLEATANAANKLLEIADLERGINAALKVLGESLNCDRLTVLRHIEEDSTEFVRLLYEWDSSYACSQMSHPQFDRVSAEGIEDWFMKLKAGDWIGGTINEFKEPFRSGQLELGVKATYSVPIFVNNFYWGAIGIDFCREPRRLTLPEIAVFQTAASCIGSAIYRQQIQQDKEQAELAVLDERNRMAREIHDTLAQAFTGISLQLEAARSILSSQPEAAHEHLNRAKNLAKEGIKEARRSVLALRSEALESDNLATAISQLMDKVIAGTEIEARVLIEGEIRSLNPEIEVNLFRIAQEAITNSLRHARATELTIQLIYEPDLVHLQIKDNGIGFEPLLLPDDSFGLVGIQERCDRLKGKLIINSAGDRGTEIITTIPT